MGNMMTDGVMGYAIMKNKTKRNKGTSEASGSTSKVC